MWQIRCFLVCGAEEEEGLYILVGSYRGRRIENGVEIRTSLSLIVCYATAVGRQRYGDKVL